jgi:hypothetical protein
MKHDGESRASHTRAAASTKNDGFILADPQHPDPAFIQRELDRDRRREWFLVPKALIAIAIVGVLVLFRQVYFA